MGWPQIIFGSVLIVALFGVSIAFLRGQWRTLRHLVDNTTFSLVELHFQRRQARLRFVAGIVMLLLGAMLTGAMFLEAPAQAMVDRIDANPDPEQRPPQTPEERDFKRLYGWTWLVILVLLLLLVILGAIDYMALRWFGRKQRENLQRARRSMIARERDRLLGD